VIGEILYLRDNYDFGAGRISENLRRLHQVSIATPSVRRILGRHGLGHQPANQKYRARKPRWKRFEKPQPGHRLQVDVIKFLERIPCMRRRLYQFSAIDCTRIRVLKNYDRCNQAATIQLIDDVQWRLPFRVLVTQTDARVELQSRFPWHLGDLAACRA
jgi:hypothetical protein